MIVSGTSEVRAAATCLPKANSRQHNLSLIAATSGDRQNNPTSWQAIRMSISVLVVDDSPMARKMLIRSLPATWDIEVAQAANGVEAIERYRQGRVDVMFLDLTMPEMDGYQVLETLRREDLNCLVIVVSADVQEAAQERVKALGAIAFVEKPVDAGKVQAVLKEYGLLV
jgi:two-component system, chemotaxis family, chemotaxis protein CheY